MIYNVDIFRWVCWKLLDGYVGVGVKEVTILGQWQYLGDTGDICCHFWQHILVKVMFYNVRVVLAMLATFSHLDAHQA